jgi:hypothetical protein
MAEREKSELGQNRESFLEAFCQNREDPSRETYQLPASAWEGYSPATLALLED